MFTGIIEEVGTISSIIPNNNTLKISIITKDIINDTKLGDSIAVNGVCLTVNHLHGNLFDVDVMPETFNATSLKELTTGSQVNLERSLAIGGRMGGHFVTGHVDGVGFISEIKKNDNALEFEIKIAPSLARQCIYKGSISIDGTSLTIFGLSQDSIKICLIPHTINNTILGNKKVGSIVNVECDMIGKYVANLMQNQILNNQENINV